MDKYSVGALELTEHTPFSLGSSLMDVGNSLGDPTSSLVSTSRNSSLEEDEDDDVVFIESIQPPSTSAPAVADQRNFTSSKNEKLQGSYSIIFPSSRDLASKKGNISETIVIDDEDIETNGVSKYSSGFIECGLPGTKNRTKDWDFSITSLSRSKNTNLGDIAKGLQSSNFGVNMQTYTPSLTSQTKTGVEPFNPGRMSMSEDVIQNGGFSAHHSPESWISQSASFPRNQKQPRVDSLSPVASLPKQIFQPSTQQRLTKPAKITCAHCKNPLQKGQTAYQRKGSVHLFCSTTCLSSFSHKRTPKKQNVICKKYAPTKKGTIVSQMEFNEHFQEFSSISCLSPYEGNQNLRKRVLNKSRCTICSKLAEIRHEVSVNNVTHKLCSNQCFNKYRLANGLIMNCCEQCGEYLPSKSAGNNVLIIEGQQTRFCCQSCVNEYKQIMETKSKLSASENRKRNAVREENGRKSCVSLNTCLEKIEGIPQRKEKTSEQQVSVEYSKDTSLIKQDMSLPSMLTIPDKLQEKNSEDSVIPIELSADPGTWPRILNIKQRETLVENDLPQVRNFDFPKDNTGRKFSETYYTRVFPDGEKYTRCWLLYSTSKDSVFCLYCRLFGQGKNQLKNENGCKDWQHLSHILSKHEESDTHINNGVKYSKLQSDLRRKKTVETTEHRLHDNEKNDMLYTQNTPDFGF